MDELRHEIDLLKAEIALTSERLPKVDRASKRRDKRQVFAGFGLFAVAVMIAGTMSASALSGTNTVDSGDIVDGTIINSDIKADAILGSRVRNDSLTGADINESTLAIKKVLTARVSSAGALYDGDATTSAKNIGGEYVVTFPREVESCTAVVNSTNLPLDGNTFLNGAFATTEASGAVLSIHMRVFTGSGTVGAVTSFGAVVACP